MKFPLSCVLLGCLLSPVAGMAQNVNVTVNATQTIRSVDERVFGANSVIWDSQANSGQTISLLQQAGLRTVRVPGGSLSDEYHWRVNKSLTNTWTWASHFGKFVDLISNLNANAMVTVNYGTGTPEEAAALVAYLNSPVGSNVSIGSDGAYDWGTSGTWAAVRAAQVGPADEMSHLRIGRAAPLNARYFEIGNECYGSWETDQQAVKNDPTTYANRVQLYVTKMKAVDPTIKIGVVVVRSDENASYKNWTPTMLARLKALNVTPDFIIYHRYPQAPGSESDAGLLQQAAGNDSGWAKTATDLRSQLNTYLGAAGAGVEIVVTENNSVFSNPGKQSTSLVNGLYLADSVANVMKTEINGFMWWAIRNGPPTTSSTNQSASLYGWRMYGDYGMISTPYSEGATTFASDYNTPYPTYYAMKMLQYFARNGDAVVTAASSSNLLSVFAARRGDGSLTLLVLNKDPNNTLSASIALTGFTPGSTATVYSYGKPQDNAAMPGGSGSTDIATSQLAVPGTTLTASFGSYSTTVIVFSGPPVVTTTPPAIVTQPASQSVVAGNAVTFTAAASGTPAPTYQWRKNGASIGGATNATYTIASANPADAGTYTVVASNSAGAVTSNGAVLTVVTVANDFSADGRPDLLWQNTLTGQRSIWLMNGLTATGGVDLGTLPVEWVIAGSGDFTGDGKTDLVWQNTVTGQRSIWVMNGTSALYGVDLGTVPLDWWIAGIGDFNADGKPDILWTNTTTNERSIWLMNGTTPISGVSLGVIPFEWAIAGAADFNRDGQTDILWSNVLTGERSIWLMNGTNATAGISLGIFTPRLQISGTGDYNGDGYIDILLSDQVSGERSVWLMNGTSISSTVSLGTVSPDWILNRPVPRRVPVDFNADNKSDIVWQNTVTGERAAWLMNGTTALSGISLGTRSTDWEIAATGDFNSDGRADLLWQNTVTGERNIWLMNGGTKLSEVALPTIPVDWKFRATGDFNLDGAVDLLLQNTTTGECAVWYMSGATPSGGASLGVQPVTMQLVGCGDFNADSKADLVWTNTATGERSIWLMNGTTMASSVSLGVVPLQWEIVGTGDFDQDGNADLVWQNTATGERSIWLMSGTTPRSGVSLGTAPTAWSIRN